ncbi:hypothetical protein [Haloplanus sp. C73]|uniref:hypothetical protein n=1 Tax=Haloplanus sp. C73 TaxID=3421641 RepID=UPI003EB7B34B
MTASGGAPSKKGNEVQHLVTQDTRFQIIQNILAHPESLPSLRELEYVVDKGRSTIYEHLKTLEENDITTQFEYEDAGRDQPSTFYGLTPYGLRVVDELNLFNDLDLIRAMYESMDKPEEVEAYENAPRPEKATQEELKSELTDHLETADETEGKIDKETQRRIEGLSYTLEQSSEADLEASAAQELGQRLLDVLNDSDVGPQVLDGLREIAKVKPDAISPTIPRLIDLLDRTNSECQTKALQVLVEIATSEKTSFDTDVRERLTNLDILSIVRELPIKEAQLLVEGLDDLYAEIDAIDARAGAMFALGRYAGSEALEGSDADEEFETAFQAFETAATQYERIGSSIKQAEALHLLGLCRSLADSEPVTEPFTKAASLFRDEGDFESAAEVYAHLAALKAKNSDVEAATEYIDEIGSLNGEIDDETTNALIAAGKALIEAHRDNVEEAASLLDNVNLGDANEMDKAIFGSSQIILSYMANDKGHYTAAIELARSAQKLADENGITSAKAHAEQALSRASLGLDRFEDAKEHLETAVEYFDEIGDHSSAVDSLKQLASIQVIDEEFGPAISTIERGLALLDEGATTERANLQLTLAEIHSASGDLEAQEMTLEAAEELLESEETIYEHTQAELRRSWGTLEMGKENPKAAIDAFSDAVEQYADTEDLTSALTTQIELADAYREIHEYSDAIDWLDVTIDLSEKADRDVYRSIALFKKAEIHRDQDKPEAALEAIRGILDSSEQLIDQPIVTGRAQLEQGTILADMERYDEARESLTDALATFREEDASHLIVTALRNLVQIGVETKQSEQVISWCQSAESYLDECDENLLPEAELYFVETRASHQAPKDGVEDLLYVGLRYLDRDQIDDALQPLRKAWKARTDLDSSTDAYTAALSAGIGFVAATRLVTLDEAQEAGTEALGELKKHADADTLSDPAYYLYQFLADSTDTHEHLEMEAANPSKDRLQLEAAVFRDLVNQLRHDDDDFESDPTEPITSTLGSTSTAVGTAVQQQTTGRSPVSSAGATEQRSAD